MRRTADISLFIKKYCSRVTKAAFAVFISGDNTGLRNQALENMNTYLFPLYIIFFFFI